MFDALLQDLQRLALDLGQNPSGWQAPALEATALRMRARPLAGAPSVREELARFARQPGCVGWIETPQTLVAAGESCALPDGVPLHAELCAGARSLCLRWGDGEWLLTELLEPTAAAEDTEVLPCLAETQARVSVLPTVASWHYRVYHRLDPHGQLRPFAARLSGAALR